MRRFFKFLLFLSIASFILSMMLDGDLLTLVSSGSIHLALFSIAMFFLWKKDLSTTLKSLDFPGSLKKNILFTVAGLFAIFGVLIIFSIISEALDFNDQEKVTEKVLELPLFILIFAILAAPVSEELFFRALLVRSIGDRIAPWAGVVSSAFLFGLLHFAYGSVVEVIGAFLIGIILAIVFYKSRSITPCLIIHMIYNLLAIIVMRFLI